MNRPIELDAPAGEYRHALVRARQALKREAIDPWPAVRYGHLAGALFIVGALGAIPNYFLEEPRPDALYWVVVAAALASAAICLAVPWERLGPR
jgi:hypothetical protein